MSEIRTVEADGTRSRHLVPAFALLAKGAVARATRGGAFRTLLMHVVVPVGVVWFLAFLDTEVTRNDGWPMLAIAGAVWLLFANGLTQCGMSLWYERRLLVGTPPPPWLLVSSSAVVPVSLFVLHVTLIDLAIAVLSTPYHVVTLGLVLPAGIALATGVGVGILFARLCAVRPGVVTALPVVVAASLVLTPEGAGETWCRLNPLCAATELARSDVSDTPAPIPDSSTITAIGSSFVLLTWGFLVMRRRRQPFAPGPGGPALVLADVSTDGADSRARGGVGRAWSQITEAVGPRGSGRLPRAGPPSLHDVSITLDRGEIVAVVGAAGAGQA